MRIHLPDKDLAQTIALIWLGFLVAGVVAWLVYSYWRKRHPPPPATPPRSYSQQLQDRLTAGRVAGKQKRRGGSNKSNPRHH